MEKIRKDSFSLENVKQDLIKLTRERLDIILKWRLSYAIPFFLIFIILFFLSRHWLYVPFIPLTAYHLIRLIIDVVKNRLDKRLILKAKTKEDFFVSVERFSHSTEELIYEPYWSIRGHATKLATFFVLTSSIKWRLLCPRDGHYAWSELYRMENLMNSTLQGDEFYFISLKSRRDIAYIYNTKLFEFKE